GSARPRVRPRGDGGALRGRRARRILEARVAGARRERRQPRPDAEDRISRGRHLQAACAARWRVARRRHRREAARGGPPMNARMSILLGSALMLAVGWRTGSPTHPAAARALEARSQENLNAVLWMQTSAEYRESARQAYRIAAMQLDAALRDPAWTAAVEQPRSDSTLPPAVVLDLDETVLDNSAYEARLVHDGRAYSEDDWNRWCEERKAGAVPGAIEFLTHAHDRGVTAIYISNRDHSVEQATRDVM